jgi:hypothetical protein
MRRVAALAVLFGLTMLCSPAWCAPASDSSPWNFAVQAGRVFEEKDHGSMGTMTVAWSRSKLGGLWAEFGVLNPRGANPHLPAPVDTVPIPVLHQQFVEYAAGFMLGGFRDKPFYFKFGLGAYYFDGDSESKRTLFGGSLGFGAIVGPAKWTARPMLEARLHFVQTTDLSLEENAKFLGAISGGVWFH